MTMNCPGFEVTDWDVEYSSASALDNTMIICGRTTNKQQPLESARNMVFSRNKLLVRIQKGVGIGVGDEATGFGDWNMDGCVVDDNEVTVIPETLTTGGDYSHHGIAFFGVNNCTGKRNKVVGASLPFLYKYSDNCQFEAGLADGIKGSNGAAIYFKDARNNRAYNMTVVANSGDVARAVYNFSDNEPPGTSVNNEVTNINGVLEAGHLTTLPVVDNPAALDTCAYIKMNTFSEDSWTIQYNIGAGNVGLAGFNTGLNSDNTEDDPQTDANYRVTASSPLYLNGTATAVQFDLDGAAYALPNPTQGCYEV